MLYRTGGGLTSIQSSGLPLFTIPANRTTTWQPGVTYNVVPNETSPGYVSGIPSGRTISTTLSPLTAAYPGDVVTVTVANPGVVSFGAGTNSSHGFTSTSSMFFFDVSAGGTLPGGLLLNTAYFPASGFSSAASSFSASLTAGGSAIQTTSAGSGTFYVKLDDTTNIQNAIFACASGQAVKLNTGVFAISGIGVFFSSSAGSPTNNNITLRGSGSGSALSTGINGVPDIKTPGKFTLDSTATQLVKYDRVPSGSGAVIPIGNSPNYQAYASHTLLASDGVKGSNQCTIASNPAGLAAGQVVMVEMVTDFVTQANAATASVTVSNGVADIALTGASSLLACWGNDIAITIANGNPGVATFTSGTCASNGITSTSTMIYLDVSNGGALPAGLNPSTPYFPASGFNSASASFSVSSAPGGTAINTSGGSGSFYVGTGLPYTNQGLCSVVWFTTTANGFTTSKNYYVRSVGANSFQVSATSFNHAADAAFLPTGNGAMTIAMVNVDHPDVFWGPNNGGAGDANFTTRATDHLQDSIAPFGARSIGQTMRIQSVTGTGPFTITFEGIFHFTFPVARLAQISVWSNAFTYGIGIEDMFIFGGMSGNIFMGEAAYCWIKNVDSLWCNESNITIEASYRCELRDSFIHESMIVEPGGAGYLQFVTQMVSDCLIENSISWYGNKNITMQSAGGGNVIAYCYMDDALDGGSPNGPEAGVNAGHNATAYMTLIEGCYSHNFKGDSFWGASPYTTAYRNWISALRAAAPPLNTYSNGGNNYGDFGGRIAFDVQQGSYKQNIVGNILGFSGQRFLGTENAFQYEELTVIPPGATIFMYSFGALQNSRYGGGTNQFDTTTINTQLRQGNYDFVTTKQIWYANIGDTGMVSTGPTYALANSLYIPGGGPPAFWSGTSSTPPGGTWPPVNPSNGTVSKIPAHKRFETITGLTIPPGNQP